jgi:hydroxyacylglutathione hydrolase
MSNNTIQLVGLKALRDNYIWVIYDSTLNQCVVVDPGEAGPVLHYLDKHQIVLSAILVTHKHWDHTAGIDALCACFPKTVVYGPVAEQLSQMTRGLVDKEQFGLFNNKLVCTVYAVPGHTLGHIAYYLPNVNGLPVIFTGDTLFSGGCGRVFEGTYDQLYTSLLKLSELPEETRIYCGHEYTVTNLKFAYWLEPQHPMIQDALEQAKEQQTNQQPTLPSVLKIECLINPFLRCDTQSFIAAMKDRLKLSTLSTPLALFTHLRNLKNDWHESYP